jgi:hypothetical protein
MNEYKLEPTIVDLANGVLGVMPVEEKASTMVTRDEVVKLAERVGFQPHLLPPRSRDEWTGRMMLFAHYLLEERNRNNQLD